MLPLIPIILGALTGVVVSKTNKKYALGGDVSNEIDDIPIDATVEFKYYASKEPKIGKITHKVRNNEYGVSHGTSNTLVGRHEIIRVIDEKTEPQKRKRFGLFADGGIIGFREGQKVEYYKSGALDFEEIDEANNAGLIEGQIYTVEQYDPKDNTVKIVEATADIWMSAEHFISA